MPTNPVVSPLLLDLLGVFAFGLSGGLVAVRKRLDLFGVSPWPGRPRSAAASSATC